MCKINFDCLAFLALISLISNFSFPQYSLANTSDDLQINQEKIRRENEIEREYPSAFQGNVLIQPSDPITPIRENKKAKNEKTGKTIWVLATAYSSTPDQCDENPFVTASGTRVRNGTIAANFLCFGTKVKFPSLYGEKIFIVEDRMKSPAPRKVDIWFSTREGAMIFGAKRTQMVILDS